MSKKFILFIVEGNNDKRELDAILHSKFFDEYRDKYQPEIVVMNGDITASAQFNVGNIQKKLNDVLMDFRRKGVPFSNIKISEIQEIVQIVDLDGVFIPYENIIRGEDNSFSYTDETIITSNVDGAYGRNKKKADILEKLVDIDQVGGVPYSVYYVSCNMDHVLFNERSLSQGFKNDNSLKFQVACSENSDILLDSIFNESINYEGNYYDSWQYVSEECNSLNRHTNLNLFFSEKAKNSK